MGRKMSNRTKQNGKRVSKKDLIQELDKADDRYKEVYEETKGVIEIYNNLLEEASDTVHKSVDLLSSVKNVPVKDKNSLQRISIELEQYESSKQILENERKRNIKESLYIIAGVLFGGAAKYYIDKVSDDDSDSVKGLSIIIGLLAAIAFLFVKIKNHLRSVKSLSKSLNKAKLETEKLLGTKERMQNAAGGIISAKRIVEEDYRRLNFAYGKNYRDLDNDIQIDLGNMFHNTESLAMLLKAKITVEEG